MNFEQNTLNIYPNVTHEILTVVGEELELSELKIYNTTGQDVTSMLLIEHPSEDKVIINVGKLSAGIYYLRTKTITNKFCKY